jgi:hypothetical protein
VFVAASGVDASRVTTAIPPACRREPSPARAARVVDDGLLLELPEWGPRASARQFVPSLSLLGDLDYAVRFELSVRTGTTWSAWAASATIGPGHFRPLADAPAGLACDVDTFTAATAVDRVRLRIRLGMIGLADTRQLADVPWIATLSASDQAVPPRETGGPPSDRLAVPALSQLDAPTEIARRICSPTSVAMVLAYWGAASELSSVAAEVFHADTDRYGVWPAAIRAAGRRGIAGYLLRFPDWASAAWCLARKLPIIASVRYATGELSDAPLAETDGHLIVLTGCDDTHVFVNDPVAPTIAEVPRRYRLAELHRAWLERTGIGYVLFPLDQRRPSI